MNDKCSVCQEYECTHTVEQRLVASLLSQNKVLRQANAAWLQKQAEFLIDEEEFMAEHSENVRLHTELENVTAQRDSLAEKNEMLLETLKLISQKKLFIEPENSIGTMNDGWEIAAQYARNAIPGPAPGCECEKCRILIALDFRKGSENENP